MNTDEHVDISELVTDTPPASRGFLIPLCQAMFLSGLVLISVGPLLPEVMTDLHIPLGRAGIIPMGVWLGRGAGGLALITLFARIPVARMLRLAYLVVGAGLIGVGLLSTGPWSFFGLCIVVGFATAMPVSLPGLWITSRIRSKTERPMTAIAASYAVATVVVPWTIGALLAAGIDWRWIPVGEGLLSILFGLLPIGRFLPDVESRQNLTLRHLRSIYRAQPRLFAALVAGVAIYVGMESSFGVWFPKFHQAVLLSGVTSAALTVTLYWAGQLVGRLTILRMFHSGSRSMLILFLACSTAVLVVLIALSPAYWVSAPAIFVLGLANSVIWPLLTSFCSRFPSWHAGTVYTIAGLVGAGASALFPYGIAPAASSLGFRYAILLLVIPALAIGAVAVYLKRSVEDERRTEAPATATPLD